MLFLLEINTKEAAVKIAIQLKKNWKLMLILPEAGPFAQQLCGLNYGQPQIHKQAPSKIPLYEVSTNMSKLHKEL